MQKRTVRGATVRHDGDLVSFACHCVPLAAQPPATRARRGPQNDTLVDALEREHRVAACRGKCLAAAVILSGLEACRSPGLEVPWLVFPASSSCRGLFALPPTWRAKDVGETDPRTPMGPADRVPFRFGGGRRSHEERIEAKHTSSLPSFGALRRDNTPTVACLIVLSSCSGALSATVHTRPSVSVFWFRTLLYVAHGPPFICLRGHRQVATQIRVQM